MARDVATKPHDMILCVHPFRLYCPPCLLQAFSAHIFREHEHSRDLRSSHQQPAHGALDAAERTWVRELDSLGG